MNAKILIIFFTARYVVKVLLLYRLQIHYLFVESLLHIYNIISFAFLSNEREAII